MTIAKKIILRFFSISLFLIFTGCSNLNDSFNSNSSDKAYYVSGNVNTGFEADAYPPEILQSVKTENTFRSAFPEKPQETGKNYKYVVSAYLQQEDLSYSATAADACEKINDASFELKLNKAGSYKLVVKVYYDYENVSTPYFSGEKIIVLTEDISYLSDIILNASIDTNNITGLLATGATGNIQLTYNIEPETEIAGVIFLLDGVTVSPSPGISENKIVFSKTGVSVGTHSLQIKFIKGTIGSDYVILYTCYESINVYKGLTTSEWVDNTIDSSTPYFVKNASGKTEFKITKELIEAYKKTVFYVGGASAAGSNSGTYEAPLDTVKNALKEINLINDGVSEYTIYLLGDISDNNISVNSTTKALKLKIASFGDDVYKIDAGNINRVLSVGGGSISNQVTLENIIITGGQTTSDGGGILVDNKGKLIVNNGTSITENKCAGTGGGIALNGSLKSEVILNGGVISNNTAGTTGGGISLSAPSHILTMNGGEISNNTISFTNDISTERKGCGLYCEAGTVTINGGKIQNNYLESNLSNGTAKGVGVYAHSADFTITGTRDIVEIKQNTSSSCAGNTVIGAGICIDLDGISTVVSMKNLIISCNTMNASQQNKHKGAGLAVIGTAGKTLSLENVTIQSNQNSYAGGGVYIENPNVNANLNVNILSNKAASAGGGLYVKAGQYKMNGGIIAGNTGPTSYGKGVHLEPAAILDIGGLAKIDSGNDIYLGLLGSDCAKINISSNLRNLGTLATITPLYYNNAVVYITASSTGILQNNYKRINVTPQISGGVKHYWKTNSTGLIQEGIVAKIDSVTKNISVNGTVYEKTKLESSMTTTNVTIPGSGTEGVFTSDRTVTLSKFEIGKYKVTNELYCSVMGGTPESGAEKKPIGGLCIYEMVVFCNKLSLAMDLEPCYSKSDITDWNSYTYTKTTNDADDDWDSVLSNCDVSKNGYRLPTEAEWEFAARGGDTSAADWNYKYAGCNGDDELVNYAWYGTSDGGDSENVMHEVGLKLPNRLGLYDMSGNGFEFVNDFSGPLSTGNVTNPLTEKQLGNTHCRRSGTFNAGKSYCEVAKRQMDTTHHAYHYSDSCFRLCRTITE